jgi:hypothetical protein
MNITVLTPTIGTTDLERCVNSVSTQTINKKHSVRHLVVADGKQYLADATKYAMKGWQGEGLTPRIYAIPDNTGANGWNGHKIYAHFAQLIDCDYLFLLDEDNTFQPDHIETLLPIAEKHGFAWSMRNIYTKSNEYLGIDRVESIGLHLNANGYALVDTSCWCLRKDNINMLRYFLEPWSGDRTFTKAMIEAHNGIQQGKSDLATLNYYAPDRLIDYFKSINSNFRENISFR